MSGAENRNLGTADPTTGFPCPFTPEEDPLYAVIRTYLAFLQSSFKQLPEGTHKWDATEDQTEIIITDQAPVKIESVGRVPHIVSIRGPVQSADLVMDHSQQQSMDGQQRTHRDMLPGSLTLNCIARDGVVAQRIAYIAYWFVKRFRRILLKHPLIHETGRQMMISGETSPGSLVAGDAEPGPIMVSVTVPFWVNEAWLFEEEPDEDSILKEMELSLGVGFRGQVEAEQEPAAESCASTPEFRAPRIRGRTLFQRVGVGESD